MTVHTDSENGLAQDRRQPIFRTNADTQSYSSTFRIIPLVKIRLSYNDSDDYMCSTYILHVIIPFQELKVDAMTGCSESCDTDSRTQPASDGKISHGKNRGRHHPIPHKRQ